MQSLKVFHDILQALLERPTTVRRGTGGGGGGGYYEIFCYKGGKNLKREGELPLFYYFTVRSHLLSMTEK